jgi:hypothetical protein
MMDRVSEVRAHARVISATADWANLRALDGHHRGSVAIEGRELDLESLSIAIHMYDGSRPVH